MKFTVIVFLIAMFAKDLNAGSLSAMDVIVVEQADGSFVCSPFYVQMGITDVIAGISKIVNIKVNGEPVDIRMEFSDSDRAFFHVSQDEADEFPENSITDEFEDDEKKYRLTSEQIKSLNLKHGSNEVEFKAGINRCKCNLFRWKYTDKVVISDIDGTITKSDVLGFVLPMIGKDWTHSGVAELFAKIERNGYKFLYLSARAIAQSRLTRNYLREIQQGSEKMPEGPVLLNPTSMMGAVYNEVIKRQSELFKIESLNYIKELFPENPFYAGYGNRIKDEYAYTTVGIQKSHIFIVNSKGQVKYGSSDDFLSTYRNMTQVVDNLYPSVIENENILEFSN